MPSRRSLVAPGLGAVAVVLLLLVPGAVARPVPWTGYPPLPEALDRDFLPNLSAPSLAPGGGGSIDFSVSDPLAAPLADAQLTLGVYAFNGFPGNATGGVPVAGAPVLTTPSSSGAEANVSLGSVLPGRSVSGSIGIQTSATTPSGTFAVRTALAFSENGTAYRLESRGWFSDAVWANATELPNGSVTLNLSRLGVSGVIPETAVLVSSSALDWAIYAIAGAGVVLVGVGAFVYFRRVSKSSAGAR
ncbi:MAG TPA: hypothetical protein VMG81_05215 [Thermoplasmata archaeon]|nr:hypothetical protein [Thermoplasmata archaeon]